MPRHVKHRPRGILYIVKGIAVGSIVFFYYLTVFILIALVLMGKIQCYVDGDTALERWEAIRSILNDGQCAPYRNT